MPAPGETRDTPPLPRRRRLIVLAAIVLLAAVLTGLVLMRPPPDPAEELLENIRLEVSNSHVARAVRTMRRVLGTEDLSDAYQVQSVIEAFGPETAPALIRGLDDPEEAVRTTALDGLHLIRPPTAVPALVNCMKTNSGDFQRRIAAQVLGDIGDPVAVPALIDVLKNPNLSMGQEAARALGQIGDPAAVPALIEALCAPDSWLRFYASEALGFISDKRAVPPLIKALCDAEARVRVSAAFALGDFGDTAQAEHLLPLLNDSDQSVRSAAAKCLAMLGRPEGVPVLAEEVGELPLKRPLARYSAVAYLACLNSPEARQTLEDLKPDADQPWVTLASNALKMGGVKALVADLRGPYHFFAAEALVHLADESARPALVEASLRRPFFAHGRLVDSDQRYARLALRRLDRRAAKANAATSPTP